MEQRDPGLLSKAASFVRRLDAWSSTVLGIGTAARDKTMDATFGWSPVVDDAQLASLYDCNYLVSRIVDVVPDETLREPFGLTIQMGEQDDAGERAAVGSRVLARCSELRVVHAVTTTHKWARALRGGAIFLDVDDGQDASEPLRESAIRSVRALRVIPRTDLVITAQYADERHPRWGQPALYQWTPRMQGAMTAAIRTVHETRLVVIDGKLVSTERRAQFQGWGAAEADRIFELARDWGITWAAVANLMQVSSQAVYRMRGLIDAIAEGESAVLEERMRLTELFRSISRALLLDAGDEDGKGAEAFELHSVSWAGIPDLLDRWALLLSAATGIPSTVLFGRSPAGLNATGESDSQTWEKLIRAEQARVTRPALEQILRVIFLAKDGPTGGREPSQWEVTFPPLRLPTPNEQAALRKLVADTDAVYVQAGALLPEEVAVNRFRSEGWNAETQVDLEARRALLESDRALRAGEPATLEASVEAEPAPAEAKDPTTALNGAQIAEMRETIAAVARGELPRETGVQILASAFPFDLAAAERIMGEVGKTFLKEKAPIQPQFGGPEQEAPEQEPTDELSAASAAEEEEPPVSSSPGEAKPKRTRPGARARSVAGGQPGEEKQRLPAEEDGRTDAEAALTREQTETVTEVLRTVARGELPRETAVELLQVATRQTREAVESIVGDVGRGFVPRKGE